MDTCYDGGVEEVGESAEHGQEQRIVPDWEVG